MWVRGFNPFMNSLHSVIVMNLKIDNERVTAARKFLRMIYHKGNFFLSEITKDDPDVGGSSVNISDSPFSSFLNVVLLC